MRPRAWLSFAGNFSSLTHAIPDRTLGANIAPLARGLDDASGRGVAKGAGLPFIRQRDSIMPAGIATLAGITAIAKQAIEMVIASRR
jgi:hypothetical protein